MVDIPASLKDEIEKVERFGASVESGFVAFVKKVWARIVAGWKWIIAAVLGTGDKPTWFAHVFGKAAEWVFIALVVFGFWVLADWFHPAPAPQTLNFIPVSSCKSDVAPKVATKSAPAKVKHVLRHRKTYVSLSVPQLQLNALKP